MESYIVRIYRRSRKGPRTVVGVVEAVGAGRRQAFSDRDGLWRVLTAPASRRRRRRQMAGPLRPC